MGVSPRERQQFRWMTVWLMPIPLTVLVVGAIALALKSSLHEAWARGLLLVVAIGVYLLASRGLRRALPSIEERLDQSAKEP